MLGPLTHRRGGASAGRRRRGSPASRRHVARSRLRVAGEERWVAVEDAGRLRDALGTPLPVGVPDAFLEPVRDPIGDLVARYARTHGPFTTADVAARLGLGPAVVEQALAPAGRVGPGRRRRVPARRHRHRVVRRRGAAHAAAPIARRAAQGGRAGAGRGAGLVPAGLAAGRQPAARSRGRAAGRRAAAGRAVPASALESLVLPARVQGYSPAMLDELCAAGEVLWRGHGSLPGGDGWVSLHLADSAYLTMPAPVAEAVATPVHQAVVDALAGGGAFFFRRLSDVVGAAGGQARGAGRRPGPGRDAVGPRVVRPRQQRHAGPAAHPGRRRWRRAQGSPRATPRGRYGRGRPAMPSRTGPPVAAGRWSLLPEVETDPTRRAASLAEVLLDRHGVVTRGAVAAERAPGGFAAVYRVLATFEETGRCRRGYFVEGLGAAQFALPGAVDRLRAVGASLERAGEDPRTGAGDSPRALVLAATDPANPFGAAVGWPGRGEDAGHKPGRKAGALVVLVDGRLVLYVERGGRTLLTWSDEPGLLQPAVDALSLAVREGQLGRLTVQRADGTGVLDSPLGRALEEAGFHATPRGLRLRG